MHGEKNTKSGSDSEQQKSVFYYKDSGIKERHGRVPLWLTAVIVALTVWGIYYLAAYWTPPEG